ncbi:hypothetical protein [Leyella stercorea]|uniref:hypothetical protein n=1 Tax=Leyella stercorea TaxID=363265 RepID=UPI003AF70FD8
MKDINVLNEKFLTAQELWKKNEFASAFEMLDGMYKEYSAMDWIEEGVSTDADANEQQQALHYIYKDFYAHHLINYYCQLFTALVSLLDEAAKYKNNITKAYAHVDSILAELENLEKVAPSEYSHHKLWLERSDYKTVKSMLSDCCGLPQCGISQEDYQDFLYTYNHQPDLLDDEDTGEDDEDDYFYMDNDYDDIEDYFEKKSWCNIHFYCLGVVKSCTVGGNINYRSIIDKLQHDIGISPEVWQLKDDSEFKVVKKMEDFVTSKLCNFNPTIDIDHNILPTLLEQVDNSNAPLSIEVVATLNYRELGTTCIGYVVSGKLTVGDKVKLNFALGNGEHTPELDDNDVLSAKVTWIETNGTELTTKAIANQTLSFGLDIERYLLPETISSVEHYKV